VKEVKLSKFEQEIEDAAELMVPITGEKKEKLDAIIASAAEKRKKKSISIRISEHDLNRIKEQSAAEGIPYQTLITSIIHKYLNGSLVDESAIRRAIRLMKS